MTHNILCVTDLDGTFVKNSIQIHPEDLQAYEKLSAYSDFAIATGRSVKEITYIAERNHLNVVCAIGYNGAVVTEKDQVVFSKTLPPTDVGRAAMNNPYIFTQINHFFETGEELPELPFDKKLDIAEDHLKRLVDLKGEMIAVREFRGLAPHYLRGTAGAAKVRGEVSRAESVAQVEEIFATLR